MKIDRIFKRHEQLKKEYREIIKTSLSARGRVVFCGLAGVVAFLCALVLRKLGDAAPYVDSFTTVFSVLGLLLTIKRCIEQWFVWFAVNILSVVMWVEAYINGSNCLATVIMWGTYVVLAVYFWQAWRREMSVS